MSNGETLPARYELAELGSLSPSHRNGTPNPDYPHGLNERDYSLPEEKQKNEAMANGFDPRRVVTDNPDAVNGPPIVDKKGLVLGGNRRTILLSDPRAYAKYRPYLQQNAERFGLKADDVAKMQQPVLVRRVDASDAQRPELIRRLNEVPTGGIDTANDAVSAGKQITPDLVNTVSNLFQQDPDKTPLQHLSDGDTKSIAQGLLDAGAIRPNDKEKYVGANGNLTPEGARFARSVLLGGVLPDAQLLREISDTPTETKLLNGLSPLYTMKARGADIAPLREAVTLEADRQRLGIKSVNEHQAQGNLIGIQSDSTTEGKTLQSFLAGIKGNEARRAFTQLQNLVSPLEPGQAGLFGEKNRSSIADVTDAEMNQVLKSSKRITKAAEGLKNVLGGAAVQPEEPKEIHQAAHHVRDLATREAPRYLQDVRDAGAAVGLTMPSGVEVHAVKTADSLNEKLGRKVGKIPTDLLRTTLVSQLPRDAIHHQMLALMHQMKSKGYTVYAPEGAADVDSKHAESRGYRDIAIKYEKPGDPIIRELQILQPHMLAAKNGQGHRLYDEEKKIQRRLDRTDLTPEDRQAAEQELADNHAQRDAIYDAAYAKDNPDQSASGSGNPSAPRWANMKSPGSERGIEANSARNFARAAATFAGSNGTSATERGLASLRGSRGRATLDHTQQPGENQPPNSHLFGGAAVRDERTPGLFDEPARAREEVPVSKQGALKAYKTLTAWKAEGKKLSVSQEQMLENAERVLGQQFLPGTDETRQPTAPKVAPYEPGNLQSTRAGRAVHQSLFDTGQDVQRGQSLLFGGAVADHPDVEKPLTDYVNALRQGELNLEKPIHFSKEFQTDLGRPAPVQLVDRAQELETHPGEEAGATPELRFSNHLDVADRLASSFHNIHGIEPDDARQVARTALATASDGFNAARGVPFKGYASAVIRNALRDEYRRQTVRSVEQPTLDAPVSRDREGLEATGKDYVRAPEPTSSQEAARNDAHARLRNYIDRVSMPDSSREALRGLMTGKTNVEIAREQGVTPQRISAAVGIGLEKLRSALADKKLSRADFLGAGAVAGHAEVDDAGLAAYVKGHGIKDPQADQRIKEAFAQSSLPGFERPYVDRGARPGPVQRQAGEASETDRALVLKTPEDADKLKQAFATGDTISSLLPKYVGGRIPSFDVRGKVVRTPSDFAKLAWAVRSPYVETVKMAVLDNRLKKEIGDFHP
jgi:RNA polymerase sigma factor (sigma-70 family)